MSADPFDVLELPPGASPQEITAAYRRLGKLYHPDVHVGSDAETRREAYRRMVDINQARHLLRRRMFPNGGQGSAPTLLNSHYFVFEPTGKSSVTFEVKDDQGRRLAEVREGPASADRALAREIGHSSSIMLSGAPFVEVSQMQRRLYPMVKIQNVQKQALLGHIARRGYQLWIEPIGEDTPSTRLLPRSTGLVVEQEGREFGSVDESQSRDGQGFVVTVSPDASADLRLFLIAAPLAIRDLIF